MKQCPNCNKVYRDFDQYCFVCRYKLKYVEGTKKIEYAPQSIENVPTSSKPTVECPYCHSTKTKKISGSGRWLSTGLFGLASGKIGKQWHCNSCKSDF